MKKLFYSFVMLVTLVIVAGSAKGQHVAGDKFMPFPGGKYTYTLPIKLNSTSKATVTFSDPTKMSISGATTPSDFTSIASSVASLSFDVLYDPSISAGDKTIHLELEAAGGCKNKITLTVNVQAIPTISLAITGTDAACQAINPSPEDNTAASKPTATVPLTNNNTFTYLVKPTITPTSGRTYDFHFALNDYNFGTTVLAITQTGGTMTGDNTAGYDIKGATGDVTITVTFSTTPGVAEKTFTGTATSVKLNVSAGNGVYNGNDASGSAKILELPDITGGFN